MAINKFHILTITTQFTTFKSDTIFTMGSFWTNEITVLEENLPHNHTQWIIWHTTTQWQLSLTFNLNYFCPEHFSISWIMDMYINNFHHSELWSRNIKSFERIGKMWQNSCSFDKYQSNCKTSVSSSNSFHKHLKIIKLCKTGHYGI
jgi:hypothetical protein